jgi:hypothetical protein
MKTFRCSRLRKVPDANFRDQDGNYIMIACDQAIFLPMIHTAIRDGKVVTFSQLSLLDQKLEALAKM